MLEAYERLFGPKDSSFEAGGVRFIGLSPFQILEEPSLVGETRAAWLDRELRKGSRPAIVFEHMPIADDNYYVNDTELLRGVLQKHDVRALFVGHTHELAVDVFNGVTQITGDSTRDGGWTFWCELVQTGKSIALTVDVVEVTTALQAGGTPTPKRVTQVPFTGEHPGAKLAPHSVAATAVGAASVKIDANLAGRKATGVVANVYPQHVYGEQQKVAQTPMTESGNGKYTVTLPIERPVPGVHRVQLRVSDADGAHHDVTREFTVGGGSVRVVDTEDLGGEVQPAIMTWDDMVLAGSTSGRLTAFMVRAGRLIKRWSVKIGGMSRAGAIHNGVAYLPSIDHHLYAVHMRIGITMWRRNLGAPLLSRPTVTVIDGVPTVFATAGFSTYRIDGRTGLVAWKADQHQLVGGRVAVDDARVYVGSGDGNAYAFDVKTGAEVWKHSMTTRADRYGKMLYAPWSNTVLFPTDDTVSFGTVGTTHTLVRETGALRWQLGGNRHYTPGLVLPEGLLLAGEYWSLELLDPATGAKRWSTQGLYPQRFFGSGPVRDGNDIFLLGVTGRLLQIDVKTGVRTELLQVSTANTFSTPAVVRDGSRRYLVAGFQDGVVRLIAL